jgi:lipoprotein signal peptidase
MSRLQILLRRLHGERRATRTGGRRFSDGEPLHGWRTVLAVALSVALLDWTTKALIAATVPLGSFVEVWEGRVAFWHVRNHAMILGLWGDLPLPARKVIAVVAGSVALLLLFQVVGRGHRLPPGKREWAWVFVGLAFGGMLGNLGERAVHWGVTDYLSLHYAGLWLPPGNVADVALFLSIPLSVPVMFFELQARALRGTGSPAHLAHPGR